jgi:hypothetical protein
MPYGFSNGLGDWFSIVLEYKMDLRPLYLKSAFLVVKRNECILQERISSSTSISRRIITLREHTCSSGIKRYLVSYIYHDVSWFKHTLFLRSYQCLYWKDVIFLVLNIRLDLNPFAPSLKSRYVQTTYQIPTW